MRLWLFVVPLLVALSVYSEETDDYGQYVIGIDLGTTYSCVGVFKNGRVDIIQNEQGNRITPSYVAFIESGQRLIGDSAKNQLTSNPENTIFDAKRLIGREYADESVKSDMKLWPFTVVEKNKRPHVSVKVGGVEKVFSAEEVSSMVLAKLKEMAEVFLEVNVTHAVVTVPAYFNDAQRSATKDAGTIAGLNVLRIINEPTAAAIAYGFSKKEGERNVLIFDLGGGTFDVSMLSIDNGVFEVLATNGNTHLGGEDFDNSLTNYMIEEIKRKHKVDVRSNNRAVQRVRREAEKAKRHLSRKHTAEIELEDLTGDGSVSFKIVITRAKFEELNSKLFKSTLVPLEKVIKDSELSKDEIHEVIMVGGSTRIPKIQSLVRDFFGGKELNTGINPDEAVAYGAAIQAAILKGYEETQDLVLLDVNPLSLGIETQGGVMTVLIPRNTRIPVRKSSSFSTVSDNQPQVQIKAFEGERGMVKDNHLLGEFMLSGIKQAPRGVPKIEVTFQFDQNGILHVSAEDKDTGKKANITIASGDSRPTQEQIDKMIKDAETYAQEDKAAREKVSERLNLEHAAYDLKAKLEDDAKPGEKLSEEEIKKGKEAYGEVLSWLEKNTDSEAAVYKSKREQFEKDVESVLQKLGAGQSQQPPQGQPKEEENREPEDEL